MKDGEKLLSHIIKHKKTHTIIHTPKHSPTRMQKSTKCPTASMSFLAYDSIKS